MINCNSFYAVFGVHDRGKRRGMEKDRDDNKKKKRIIAVIIGAILIIGIIIGLIIFRNTITAVTMRIQRLVGSVNLYADGQEQTLREQMRLGAGQTITTGSQSLIMVSLDETKLLTMEENSSADIKTKGRKLEFDLTEGNLFFNVTEKLGANESFDVNTTTMVCGIRGTSAFVGKDETKHEMLMVTDGTVHVTAKNPVTLEETEADVSSGQMVTIYLDEEAEGNATVSLRMRTFREEDLPAFVLDSMAKSTPLMEKVTGATGFSSEKITALAEVFSKKGVSMYGQAVGELQATGITDSIPFMGVAEWEFVKIANMAADIAGDDLDLEIEIIKGYLNGRDTVVSKYDEETTERLMEEYASSVEKVIIQVREAGMASVDIIGTTAFVMSSLNDAISSMSSSDLSADDVADVISETAVIFTNAIEAAKNDGKEIYSEIMTIGTSLTGTIADEISRGSGKERIMIAFYGTGEDDDTSDEEKKDEEEEKPEENSGDDKEKKTDEETSTGRKTGNKASGNSGRQSGGGSNSANPAGISQEEIMAQLAAMAAANAAPTPTPVPEWVSSSQNSQSSEDPYADDGDSEDGEESTEIMQILFSRDFVSSGKVNLIMGQVNGDIFLNDGNNTKVTYDAPYSSIVIHGAISVKLPLSFSGGNPSPPNVTDLSQIDWETSARGLIVRDSAGNAVIKNYDGTFTVYSIRDRSTEKIKFIPQLSMWLNTI